MQNSPDAVATIAQEDDQYAPVDSAEPNLKHGDRPKRYFRRQPLLQAHLPTGREAIAAFVHKFRLGQLEVLIHLVL